MKTAGMTEKEIELTRKLLRAERRFETEHAVSLTLRDRENELRKVAEYSNILGMYSCEEFYPEKRVGLYL